VACPVRQGGHDSSDSSRQSTTTSPAEHIRLYVGGPKELNLDLAFGCGDESMSHAPTGTV
jgi:hypothetical protein